MRRFCALAVLMVMSSSAYAGESYSFSVGGHRIHIEAPRHCRSASCLSVSIPGVYKTRRRDRDDGRYDAVDAAPAPASAPTPAPVSAPAPAIVARAAAPSVQPAASCAPLSPAMVGTTASTTQPFAPPPSNIAPAPPPVATPAPPQVTASVERPPVAVKPFPEPAKVLKISREADDQPAPTPLGDWQTEGKTGLVRIEPCGRALCGRILDASSHAVGESVLINMKPNTASEWSGNIYSRDSGNTYYATMAMKGANSLRVEACALGHFFCSGNVWSRIGGPAERMITSRQEQPAPRS